LSTKLRARYGSRLRARECPGEAAAWFRWRIWRGTLPDFMGTKHWGWLQAKILRTVGECEYERGSRVSGDIYEDVRLVSFLRSDGGGSRLPQ